MATDPVSSPGRRAFFRRITMRDLGDEADTPAAEAPRASRPPGASGATSPEPAGDDPGDPALEGGAGDAGTAPPPPPPLHRRNESPEMTYARLGRTNLMISKLSLGCGALRSHNADALVNLAMDRGVNLLDTAMNYGDSEAALGRMLPAIRDRVWICTKTPPFDAALSRVAPEDRDRAAARYFRDSLDTSLARLCTDRIDVYMIQSAESAEFVLGPELEEAMRRAREDGKIRFTGLSTIRNVRETLDAAIELDRFDVLLAPIHPLNLSSYPPILDRARFKDIAVMGMMTTIGLAGDGTPEELLADYEYAELPDGLDPWQLVYLYMLKNAPVAGFLTGTATPARLERALSMAGLRPGIFAGNEVDALVYDRLWPYCKSCGNQRNFSQASLEAACMARAAMYDTSGLAGGGTRGYLGSRPHEFLEVCEGCGG